MIEDLLKRDDKISLSGGKKVIWAPEFPRYAHKLGFWDYAYFLNYPIRPLFTTTILDEQLEEIPLNRIKREWFPSRLIQLYKPYDDIEIKEEKALLQNDVLVSRVTFRNNSTQERHFRAIPWTSQIVQENLSRKNPEKTPNANFIQSVESAERLFSFQRRINNEKGNLLIRYGIAIGGRRKPNSFSISTSEYVWNYPEWKLTPFFEKLTPDGLPNDINFPGIHQPKKRPEMVYMALEYPIVMPPKSSQELHIFCSIRDDQDEAMDALVMAVQFDDPIVHSQNSWEKYFNSVPHFSCSNPYIEKYYWYRWYGIKKNMVDTDDSLGLPHPGVVEGTSPQELRQLTSLSMPPILQEIAWMHDPALAQGCILNFVANQRKDGSFPGMIATGYHAAHSNFFIGDWGRSIRQLHSIHPDLEFLKKIYPAFKKYAKYFKRERDKNSWNLYDIFDPHETGFECSSRYLFLSRECDQLEHVPLKGIDISVFMYEFFRTMSWMSQKLENEKDFATWEKDIHETRNAILKFMWNPQIRFFVDINPFGGNHSEYKSAAGFLPFLTDIAGEGHLGIFEEHLFNPETFWTDFPIPAMALDNEIPHSFGEWNQIRRTRPADGRSWMNLNSLVCEALCRAAQQFDENLKPKAVEFLSKIIEMQFTGGNLLYPTSYEYYNSFDGKPPYFRGSDDHINFSINDLIIKYIAGLQTNGENEIVIDPLPFNLKYFFLENVTIRDKNLRITYNQFAQSELEQGFCVYIDSRLVHRSDDLAKVRIDI